MNRNDRFCYFFIGTEAELIKVFPVILECRNRGIPCKIIASGQNDITKSVVLTDTDCGCVDIELSKERDIRKTAGGLLTWWFKTLSTAEGKLRRRFENDDLKHSLMVVHGDTVSSVMGAVLGRRLGMRVCHIEAGLRSHNPFSPFPEEIDRYLVSRLARVHFAPGEEARQNLKHTRGIVINTAQNTLLDSLRIAETIPFHGSCPEPSEKYAVFVMHRQENLSSQTFVKTAVRQLIKLSRRIRVVLILHELTRIAVENAGMMEVLSRNDNILMTPRVEYFDFMKLLSHAEFVITDGGSNQEELFYMGKPTLILRKNTERNEGLGLNARLYGSLEEIGEFYSEYRQYERENRVDAKPSRHIAKSLERLLTRRNQ